MSTDIEIHERADLEGSTVVVGFPGVGFSSPIAVNYLIKKLEMEQVGHVVSPEFPPVASVHNYVPQHPMRIYQRGKLVVVISEFAPQGDLIRPLGLHLLGWADSGGVERMIVLDTMTPSDLKELMERRSIYAVGATERVRSELQDAGVEQVEEGMITGLTGVLLSEGATVGIPVMGMLAEAHPMYPDVRAAVKLLEEGAKVSGELKVDLEELDSNADEIEASVKEQLGQAQQLMEARMQGQQPGMPEPQKPTQYMYG